MEEQRVGKVEGGKWYWKQRVFSGVGIGDGRKGRRGDETRVAVEGRGAEGMWKQWKGWMFGGDVCCRKGLGERGRWRR